MRVRFVALMLAVFGMFGAANVSTGAGEASAAAVYESPGKVWIAFTPAETKQIAANGIASLYGNPVLARTGYVEPDKQSRLWKYYVRGRGFVASAVAQKMVTEAAAHRNGRLWVSYNTDLPKPLTLWTRW